VKHKSPAYPVTCVPIESSTVPKPRVVVTAAVIEHDDAFLLTRRLQGTHLEGYWEFPGGKCQTGETLADSLAREIREELDASISVGPEILATTHEYPERVIELRFFRCTLLTDPHPALGQEMQWVRRDELSVLQLPPADDELVRMLRDGGVSPPTT
jgi:8-oxo-dGTP diphosphatase